MATQRRAGMTTPAEQVNELWERLAQNRDELLSELLQLRKEMSLEIRRSSNKEEVTEIQRRVDQLELSSHLHDEEISKMKKSDQAVRITRSDTFLMPQIEPPPLPPPIGADPGDKAGDDDSLEDPTTLNERHKKLLEKMDGWCVYRGRVFLKEASKKYKRPVYLQPGSAMPYNETRNWDPDHWFEVLLTNEMLFRELEGLDLMKPLVTGRLFTTRMPRKLGSIWREKDAPYKSKVAVEAFKRKVARNGLNTVLLLVEEHEFHEYGSDELIAFYRDGCGLEVIHRPIEDYHVPSRNVQLQDINDITARLVEGKNCLVHCFGGSGRTGTIVVGVIRNLGVKDPIRYSRAFKSVYLDTLEQETFISGARNTVNMALADNEQLAEAMVLNQWKKLISMDMQVFEKTYAAQDSTVASLDKDEIESFKKAFALFDKDSSGSIQTDELRAVINSLGQDVPGHVMKQMISVMDVDNSGEIDFNEFIKLMLTIPKLDDRFIIVKDIKRVQFDAGTKAQMTALFRRSDVNGDNVISANELVDCLKELNPAFDPTKAGTMLSSIDKDIDSVISFSEFQLFYWSFLHQQELVDENTNATPSNKLAAPLPATAAEPAAPTKSLPKPSPPTTNTTTTTNIPSSPVSNMFGRQMSTVVTSVVSGESELDKIIEEVNWLHDLNHLDMDTAFDQIFKACLDLLQMIKRPDQQERWEETLKHWHQEWKYRAKQMDHGLQHVAEGLKDLAEKQETLSSPAQPTQRLTQQAVDAKSQKILQENERLKEQIVKLEGRLAATDRKVQAMVKTDARGVDDKKVSQRLVVGTRVFHAGRGYGGVASISSKSIERPFEIKFDGGAYFKYTILEADSQLRLLSSTAKRISTQTSRKDVSSSKPNGAGSGGNSPSLRRGNGGQGSIKTAPVQGRGFRRVLANGDSRNSSDLETEPIVPFDDWQSNGWA